jgi:hypothetical protein
MKYPFEKPYIPRLLAPERVAQISGLSEKGIAHKLRRTFTAFGSPWRGIASVSSEVMSKLTGGQPGVQGLTVHPKLLERISSEVDFRTLTKLRELQRWSAKSGYFPILINKEFNPGFKRVSEAIRHERIHQIHMAGRAQPEKFAEEISRQGSFSKAFTTAWESEYGRTSWWKKLLGKDKVPGHIKSYERYWSELSPAAKEFHRASETLAYGNQTDRSFFSRMTQKGIADPRVPFKRKAQLGSKTALAKTEIKELRKVMSCGEGSSMAGTGMFRLLARGVRKFRGV